jgi:hypothetical protein
MYVNTHEYPRTNDAGESIWSVVVGTGVVTWYPAGATGSGGFDTDTDDMFHIVWVSA